MTIRNELRSPQLEPIVGCLVVTINSVVSVIINVMGLQLQLPGEHAGAFRILRRYEYYGLLIHF